MNTKEKKDIRIETNIREIFQSVDDDRNWDTPDVLSLPQEEIEEMVKGDLDPYFALLDIAFAVRSENGRRYTEKSINDIKENSLGVQGYLGHQRIIDRDYEYRVPQMKIIKTRVRKIIHPITGLEVFAAQGKAYVSREAKVLRTNIREKMAGSVSIDAVALLEYDNESEDVIVTDIPKVRYVDFCNPKTEGIVGAGVTAVVSEMKRTEEIVKEGGLELSEKLTKEALLTSYKDEIREIVKTEISSIKEETSKVVQEMTTKLKDTETQVKEKDLAISKHTQTIQEMTATVADMKMKNEKLQNQLNLKELEEFKAKTIAELDVSQDIKEMISQKVRSEFNGTMEESQTALKLKIIEKHEEIQEIAKISVKSTTSAGGNPPKKIETNPDYKQELVKAIFMDEE